MSKVGELESKAIVVEQEIEKLQEDIRGLESQKSRLLTEEALGQLKSKKNLEDTKATLVKLTELLADKQLARNGLKEKIGEEKENLRQEKISELSAQCDSLESAYAEGGEEIQEFEKKLSALREKGTELHKKWDSFQKEIFKLGGPARNPDKVFGLTKIF